MVITFYCGAERLCSLMTKLAQVPSFHPIFEGLQYI